MPKANINHRGSLEEAYPPDAFASDAARNALATGEVVYGVQVLSAPDPAGEFALERTAKQVGEAASPAFLAPHRREGRQPSAEDAASASGSADPDPGEGYHSFLADIVAVAREFGFRPEDTPGRDEPRLRGLRQ